MFVNMRNQSGSVIKEQDYEVTAIAPILDRNPQAQTQIEETIWRAVLKGINEVPVDNDLPTFEDGKFKMQVGPISASDSRDFLDGKKAVYFAGILRDQKTKQNLVEFCLYVQSIPHISRCYNHNKP